jgi:hypothetical protein
MMKLKLAKNSLPPLPLPLRSFLRLRGDKGGSAAAEGTSSKNNHLTATQVNFQQNELVIRPPVIPSEAKD